MNFVPKSIDLDTVNWSNELRQKLSLLQTLKANFIVCICEEIR